MWNHKQYFWTKQELNELWTIRGILDVCSLFCLLPFRKHTNMLQTKVGRKSKKYAGYINSNSILNLQNKYIKWFNLSRLNNIIWFDPTRWEVILYCRWWGIHKEFYLLRLKSIVIVNVIIFLWNKSYNLPAPAIGTMASLESLRLKPRVMSSWETTAKVL